MKVSFFACWKNSFHIPIPTKNLKYTDPPISTPSHLEQEWETKREIDKERGEIRKNIE